MLSELGPGRDSTLVPLPVRRVRRVRDLVCMQKMLAFFPCPLISSMRRIGIEPMSLIWKTRIMPLYERRMVPPARI